MINTQIDSNKLFLHFSKLDTSRLIVGVLRKRKQIYVTQKIFGAEEGYFTLDFLYKKLSGRKDSSTKKLSTYLLKRFIDGK